MVIGEWVHYIGQLLSIIIKQVQCDAKINMQYSFGEDIIFIDIGWVENIKVMLLVNKKTKHIVVNI